MIHYRRFKNRIIVLFSENSVLEHSIVDAFLQEEGTVVVLNRQDSVETIFSQYGRIDVFIAIPPKTNPDIALMDVSATDWKTRCFEYAETFFLFAGKTASLMSQRQDGGVILAVCSASAAQSGSDQDVCASVLHSSIRQFIRSGAVHWGLHRIRCQTLFYGGLSDLPDEGVNTPNGRVTIQPPYLTQGATLDDVAEASLFLCSADAAFLNGGELNVDGGIGIGTDFYSGKNSLGNAIYSRMLEAGVMTFDGSKQQPKSAENEETDEELLHRKPPDTPQTVLVTGVSRGLGRALTDRLIAEGHTVLGCARSKQAIDELKKNYGPPHHFEAVDLTDRRQVAAWAESLKSQNIVPDFIMNNAAIMGNDEPYQIWKISAESFQEVFQVNVMSSVNTIHAFVPMMLRRMKGIIVNFSSGWGREVTTRTAPYCVSKWGIEALSRCLAVELPNKMACVSLHPGIIHTESMAKTFGRYATRYPTPEEWAVVAVPFLLSLTPQDNGKAISVPGMTEFRGMARPS